MNYRHAFHAGNFADVHKHLVLMALLRHLHQKPKPFFFLDTHAGRGQYDLRSDEASRSGEWQLGIGRLLAATNAEFAEYLLLVKKTTSNTASTIRSYPGSPLLACSMLRENDRAVFVEKNPIEAAALKRELESQQRVAVIAEDGYAALKAQLPPKENRGLALIDPPYETETEFRDVTTALQFAAQRWSNGMYCVWYPIKASGAHRTMQRALVNAGLKKLLQLELLVRPADSPFGLNGSGLLILNPPWQLDQQMLELQKTLHQILSMDGDGGTSVRWLATE